MPDIADLSLPTGALLIGAIAISIAIIKNIEVKAFSIHLSDRQSYLLAIFGAGLVIVGIASYFVPHLLDGTPTPIVAVPAPTATDMPTNTPTAIPTQPPSTPTLTNTPTPTPTVTDTPTNTPTATPTQSLPTPTLTNTPTPTPTVTDTPMDTPTATPTQPPIVLASRAVALQTAHKKEDKNKYVTALGADWDWILKGETIELKEFEKFTLLCLDNGKVALRTHHKQDGKNKYVTALGADWDWVLKGDTIKLQEFEEFTLHHVDTEEQLPCLDVLELLKQGEVRIAFQTFHMNDKGDKHRYVTAMGADWDWVLRAHTDKLEEWEKFTLVPLP